jgi:uncharacterized protein
MSKELHTMKMKALLAILVVPLLTLLLPASASGADMQELQQRFKERFAKLQELKSAGTIGETSEGFVEFVKDKSSDAAKLVEAENSDRRELYALLAKDEGTTAERVGRRNAQRNFDRARSGEWLRKAGKWEQKR